MTPGLPGGVVVIGAGQGGLQAATSLREAGYRGRLTIIGDEVALPYQRPPLSKAYLTGEMREDALALRPDSFFQRHDIGLSTGDRVVGIDRCASRVALRSGRTIDFDRLVLATGARARRLPISGADLEGVVELRSRADAHTLRALLFTPRRLVVIGGGFVGTEVAAAALKLGHEVTIVESSDRLLSRVVTADVSAHVTNVHARNGSRVLLGVSVIGIRGIDGQVSAVVLTSGEELPADVVVMGIGAVPNTELAAESGLAVDNGVVVDGQLRTSDPRISAIGDCARFPCVHADGRSIRLESVQAAVDHARHVAAEITGSLTSPYAAVPWFWTEQFGVKIQIVGIGLPGDETTRQGDVAGGAFSVLRFRLGQLVCVESVNRSADYMAARKLLANGKGVAAAAIPPDPDAGIDLRELAKSRAVAR